MNSSEWQESVEKLAAQFDSQDIVGQAPRLPKDDRQPERLPYNRERDTSGAPYKTATDARAN